MHKKDNTESEEETEKSDAHQHRGALGGAGQRRPCGHEPVQVVHVENEAHA